jgi:transposase
MIQIVPQMRVLVAVAPVDFRCGIDGMVRLCRSVLTADPYSGAWFVFCNRRHTAIKVLTYDGQGFWLCHKRLSNGRFSGWPQAPDQTAAALQAHELTLLLRGVDPASVQTAPEWRTVTPRG